MDLRSFPVWMRLAVFTMLGFSVSTDIADARKPIPFCHDLKGHRSPVKGPWMEGDEPAEVMCVVDGDTFDVKLKDHNGRIVRIRLWGADCPESSFNSKCMRNGRAECAEEIKEGKKTSEKARNMLGNGKVTLKPPYANNGDRKLAYMHLANGVDFGRKLISSCLCSAPSKYKHKRKKDYRRAADRCNR